MDIAQHLANTLKSLRQARGWSLTFAAEQTGVSKAMLGQIERNESSPTVATLWKIATGFNVPFSVFLEAGSAPIRPVFDPQHREMVVVPLFPYDPQLRFDHFSIRLAPGALSESSAHDSGVIEHVVVISGVLDMNIDGVWQTLQAGNGLKFHGDRPHAYRNSGGDETHFHSLIHYPPTTA
ncbi:DNA-binding transcriptional repressor PuuR [Cedecea neteri]|uniref:DNA-binding transcriptional repressor PuuR n=1 Tax=Cedecea neteri TaxID=158822 RepID=A0A291DYS1_9ENTR|nr:XRE family transcriptional regulator [Cedecea neteri]ATF92965.1 XRE family transcriptional regulator [Cedecea neteri]SQC93200.1 DNA-binding transcriptional repressor PuuR [Cedecea neteri]